MPIVDSVAAMAAASFAPSFSYPSTSAPLTTSHGVSLPQQVVQRFPRDSFSSSDPSDPSVRHARTFSFQTSSAATSLPVSPQRRSIWRAEGHYLSVSDALEEDAARRVPQHARCYLRPVQRVRTLSGDATPGGSNRYCAVFEPTLQSHQRPRVRLPTELECAICFEVLRSGEQVQPMMHCSHLFHKQCVDALIRSRVAAGYSQDAQDSVEGTRPCLTYLSCPMCRGQMLASSISELPVAERTHQRSLTSAVSL
eukprot:gb/GFBE01001043.1/.p1 GENE.gb/GFBE01001043.1/~~gb/GFBE01001043.1/.p1  ORF type:complete len:253 (+),score=8.20 gb/GFBE01001043.1/:1-759(+)